MLTMAETYDAGQKSHAAAQPQVDRRQSTVRPSDRMRLSWILVVVVAASGASTTLADEAMAPGLRGLMEPRLLASGIRLARIEKELNELHHRLDEAKKVDPQAFLNDLNDRIDHVEGKAWLGGCRSLYAAV